MKVLINYKPTKEKIEEFQIVRVVSNSDVFADLPIAVADFGREYDTPVIFGNYKGLPLMIEKEELLKQLENLELHHFRLEEEKLIKVAKEESEISVRLPKGTNTDQLIMDQGHIVWAKREEGDEEHGNS